MRQLILYLPFLFLFTFLNAQGEKSLAVLELDARGISAYEAASLTDRLRADLFKTGRVIVVERELMEQVLAEQDFQLAGCTSVECAVEIGQLLGVSNILAGSIGKVGTTFSIVTRTIDVETGKIIKSVTRVYRGELDGLLPQMGFLAMEIVGIKVPEDITPPIPYYERPAINAQETKKTRDIDHYYLGQQMAEKDYSGSVAALTGFGTGFGFGLIGWGVGYLVVSVRRVEVPYYYLQDLEIKDKGDFERGYSEFVKKKRKKMFTYGAVPGVLLAVLVVASAY